MNTYVIDTNVTVAWYLRESFSPAARGWQQRLLEGRIRLMVPSLHYWEFANVLRTLAKRGEIAPDLAQEIYVVHLDAPLDTVEPDPRQVLSTALESDATAYDAVYIALCLAHDVPLITAERTTRSWVRKLGSRIEHVA